MTTYITTVEKSTVKTIIASARDKGFNFNNVKAACPKECGNGRFSALKLHKGTTTIFACPCGWRKKVVLDGNNAVVVAKRDVAPPAATTKPKKTRAKAKKTAPLLAAAMGQAPFPM